ncbi:RatA -like protein [Salmonella bongori]|nr:RatA -like protein [Salmonella bongori]
MSQDNTVGLKTPLNVVLTDDSSSLISKDVIFTVLTSPDSDKAVMWGHMPETVTGNGGVKFHRPLLAVEAPSGNGSYSINNESWSSVTATNMQKTGKTGCDSDYQPRYSDLQSLYDANPDGALGTTYGWPIDGTNNYWWASDEDAVTSTYQTINLSNGAKHNTTSPTTYYRQVCLVEPHVSDPATITLTSTAMDATKKAAVVKKGAAMPLTVTITDASGKPLANQSFTLMRGDALSRSGIVVTANNEDDLKLIEQSPSSVTSTMAIKGSKISATTGADGTATFALHQDNSIGLKTTLTAQLASKTAIQTSLDTIFTVLTSPDSDKANYWGHMPETVQANGKTLQRPLLLAELPAGITPPLHITMNNEVWSMAHTIDASTWDLAAQCGSLAKAPVLKDLEELHTIFSDTGWPTSSSYSYLSQSPSGKYYCGFNQTTGHDSCIIDSKTTPGFAVCVR